ncbi:transmembrane protein 120, partial [Tanacetum coccineum]
RENTAEDVSRILDPSKEFIVSAATLISRNSQEEASLRQRALALNSNIKRLHSFIASSVKKGSLDPKDAEKFVEELSRASYTLSEGDAAAFLPSKSYGRFLRMFLGPINVHATRKDVQLKVKEEYNSFRDIML